MRFIVLSILLFFQLEVESACPFGQITLSEVRIAYSQLLNRREQGDYKLDSRPVILTPPPSKNEGRVMIVIHGMGESDLGMRQLSQFYLSQGNTVIPVLLSGHGYGRENGSALEKVSVKDWQRDVDEVISLATRLSDHVFISGYSLGGALAVDALKRNPKLKGGQLIAPALEVNSLMKRLILNKPKGPPNKNPFGYAHVPKHAFQELFKLTDAMQKEGIQLNRPVTVYSSEGDAFIENSKLKVLSEQLGANAYFVPPESNIDHFEIIRPSQGFPKEFEAQYKSLIQR